MMSLAEFLMELGALLIAFGLTFGFLLGVLWLGAYFMGGKK